MTLYKRSKINTKVRCMRCGKLNTATKVANSSDYEMKCIQCGWVAQFRKRLLDYVIRERDGYFPDWELSNKATGITSSSRIP